MRNLAPAFKAVYELVEAVDNGRSDPATADRRARLKVLHTRLSVADQGGTYAQWEARLKFTLDAAAQTNRSALCQAAVASRDLEEMTTKLAAVVLPTEISFSVNTAPGAAVKPWLTGGVSQ